MASQQRIPHAVVVMPARLRGNLLSARQRRWLARGQLTAATNGEDGFAGLLRVLGLPPVQDGQAALRLWGQTGEPPAGWIAAADPVHLEARLDHLCLHALDTRAVTGDEMTAIFECLQSVLAGDDGPAFFSVGARGYVRSPLPMPTSTASPQAIDGQRPEAFMPAAAGAHDRLQSEVQMVLHEHAVNLRLAEAGRLPVNSLWFWGGGPAPERVPRPLPVLFAADPLLRGYWYCSGGEVRDYPGDLRECQEPAAAAVVAVAPEADDESATEALAEMLDQVASVLARRAVQKITMLFRDGITAVMRPGDRWRFWRREVPLLRDDDDAG